MRQVDGHGGKARHVVSQQLNVGPSDLPNASNAGLASEAEIRFKMQSHFMNELKAKEKAAVAKSAIGTGRLDASQNLSKAKPKRRTRRFSVEEMEHEAREKAEREEAMAKATALRLERNGRGGGRGRGGRGGGGRGRGRSLGQRMRRASVTLLGAIKIGGASDGTSSPKSNGGGGGGGDAGGVTPGSVRQRVRRASVTMLEGLEAMKGEMKAMSAGDGEIGQAQESLPGYS